MNQSAKQYLQKVNKQLICPPSVKRIFLRQLREDVLFFCDDHENADIGLLMETFGTPEEVAEEFLAELGNVAVNCCSLTRKKLLFMAFSIVLCTVLFSAIIGMRTDSLKQKLLNEDFTASVTYESESNRDTFWLTLRYLFLGDKEDAKKTEKE